MTTATKNAATEKTTQEVCIDLPGEQVRCWRSSDNIKVILRKHRDIFVELNLKSGTTYSIECKSHDFYCPRDKRLLRRVEFADGEPLHLWVGRDFKGSLLLKSEGRLLGTYVVNELDATRYDAAPKTKPEPLLILMGMPRLKSASVCTAEDPFGLQPTQRALNGLLAPKLPLLASHGTQYQYATVPEPPEIEEYVAVTQAQEHEIQPQVLKQLETGVAVEGRIEQIFTPPKENQAPSYLYTAFASASAAIAGSGVLTDNSFKETAGYVQQNWRDLNKLAMTVRIEKKAKGNYRVLLKGKPLTKLAAQAIAGASAAKVVHEKHRLGSKASTFIDGGFSKTGKAGYGGIKRILLTTARNFKDGLKIQGIGTIIDIIVDADTVYSDEKGSKDLSEFLARAGVSIAKAALTAALGSIIAAFIMSGLLLLTTAATAAATIAALPVAVTAVVVVLGYYAAATLIDLADEHFNVKNTVAELAK